ncbi:MAG: hypothetical protein ACR2GY_03320 [Phycisphaerales bacterium]
MGFVKRIDTSVTTTGTGLASIATGQELANCHGIVYGTYVYNVPTSGTPEVNVELLDADGRDVLNGQGQGLVEDTVISFGDIGGTMVIDETITISGSATGSFGLILYLMC